jgi:O-acetyl-ADP-ribose deacetylase (regulator of RNase III)
MQFIKGNLLDAQTEALVNTVNTVGVMGKGIALQFKEAFPNNFKVYAEACKRNEVQIGKMLVADEMTLNGKKIIINFPTKTEWFQKSKYEYIEAGLTDLAFVIEDKQIKSIAIPPLGCGHGGLKWEKVKPMIEKHLGHLTNTVIKVYEPNAAVKKILKEQDSKKDIKLTSARAMLLYAMFYYESCGENSSLFVANKLAYFLQRLGEKSFARLKFEASHYGPYDVKVGHLLRNLNGKYLKGLEQMEAKAFEPLELQYAMAPEISSYVKKELTAEQISRLKNMVVLISGFESALSLEILATVDFIKKNNPSIQFHDIVRQIHDWSDRKKHLFKEKYIQLADRHLTAYSQKMNFS